MSTSEIARELTSKPFLLDAEAAIAYEEGVEGPRRTPRVNIHTDEEAARKAGFRAPIAGGEQTYAVMANFLLDSFGIGFLRGGRLEAALVKPVFYGDKLTMHARIIERRRATSSAGSVDRERSWRARADWNRARPESSPDERGTGHRPE